MARSPKGEAEGWAEHDAGMIGTSRVRSRANDRAFLLPRPQNFTTPLWLSPNFNPQNPKRHVRQFVESFTSNQAKSKSRSSRNAKLELNYQGRSRICQHGVILKVVATNICGSDQHMVRGRTTAPAGLVLGHEITGQVVEKGRDVEFLEIGDLVSVPFNIACGRCRSCKSDTPASAST